MREPIGDPPPTVEAFVRWARSEPALPLPGKGDTAQRFEFFRAVARANASVGRLVEAHADALAILNDAEADPRSGSALAVWASGPTDSLVLHRVHDIFTVTGTKRFCGGAPIVDQAIVTTQASRGEQLVVVDLRQPGVRIDSSTWTTEAFAEASVATVDFDRVPVCESDLIRGPNWYADRPGFWHGAIGVSSLWAGMADAVLDELPSRQRHRDQRADVVLGLATASVWAVSALLDQAARQIDALARVDSTDVASARVLALSTRHAVRAHIECAMAAFDQEVGPAPVAMLPLSAARRLEISLALAQDHGDRDLALLGRNAAGVPR